MKKQIHPKIVFLVIIVLAMSSCSVPKAVYVHLPDKVNSPGFEQGREVKTDITLQPRSTYKGGIPFSYACDIGYAPINHLGIIASYRGAHNFTLNHTYGSANNQGNTATEKFDLSSSLFDFGIGYFTKISPQNMFEFYAGYGMGNIENIAGGYSNPGSYSGNYHRLFSHAAIGFIMQDGSVIRVGFRAIYKKFDAFNIGSQTEIDSSAINQVNTNYLGLLQPFLELNAGKGLFRFSMQVGYQLYFHSFIGITDQGNIYDLNKGYIYNPTLFYINLGTTFHYPRYFRKQNFRNVPKEDNPID